MCRKFTMKPVMIDAATLVLFKTMGMAKNSIDPAYTTMEKIGVHHQSKPVWTINRPKARPSGTRPMPTAQESLIPFFISSTCMQIPYQRSEEHTSELQSRFELVCRLLLEKKK